MKISMIPSNDVKTIHASQDDTQREWCFEPFDNSGTLIIGEESLANIERIKGNTLAFNQLAKYTNHANATVCGLTITNNNNGSFTISGTYNASGDRNMYGYISIISAVSGHKYLVKSTGSLMAGFVYGSASGNRDATEYIVTASSSGNMETAIRLIDSKANNGQVVNETIWVNIFDLTLMGIDTIEQFKSYFPLPYYSYQSTLLPFKGTGIKTTGKNLFHNTAVSATNNGITWTVNEDGSVTANGTCTNNVSVFRMYTPMLMKGSYFINGTPSGSAWGGSNPTWRIRLGHQDGSYINDVYSEGRAFTLTQDEILEIQCNIAVGKTVSNQMWFPMTTFQGADSTFEPYKETITDLPTLTYFPNGMKSAGNVYDELLPTKAITRVGMVDLGSLDWTASASGVSGKYRMISDTAPSGIKIPPNNDTVSNTQSAKYTAITPNSAYNAVNGLAIATNGRIIVYDDAYSTSSSASAFKSAMSNVYLYYELATETETDVNAEIFYPVYQYGTEQILPINGTNPTTSPFVGDIYYADGLKTDQTFLYRQTPINYNTRQFALVSKNTQTPLTLKDGKGYCNSPLALTNESGFFDAKLKMTDSDGVCYSEKFQIHVERKP